MISVVRQTFGPVHTERELERMNYSGTLGTHGGCWVNGVCREPDCPMRLHDDTPEPIDLDGERLPTCDEEAKP